MSQINIMNNKCSKPKLVDPILGKKIIKALNPPKADYWEPTKSGLKDFFDNWIRPNIYIVIIIIFFLLFLLYRYRVVKREKEIRELKKVYGSELGLEEDLSGSITGDDEYPVKLNKQQAEQLSNILMSIQQEHKIYSHEPKTYKKLLQKEKSYPIYPEAGGSLHSKRKKK